MKTIYEIEPKDSSIPVRADGRLFMFFRWLSEFGLGFVVAAPTAAFVVPPIQKFFDGITEGPAAR